MISKIISDLEDWNIKRITNITNYSFSVIVDGIINQPFRPYINYSAGKTMNTMIYNLKFQS